MCLTGPGKEIKLARRVRVPVGFTAEQPENTLLAWRVWKLRAGDCALLSTYAQAEWQPGKPMEAGGPLDPNRTQGLGVYGYKTLDEMMMGQGLRHDRAELAKNKLVVGRVLLWGKAIEHDNGWRAEKGYPFELYVASPGLQLQLRNLYYCSVKRMLPQRLLLTKKVA